MTAHPGPELSAYIDGDLEPAARREVETHVAACAECRAVVDDLRALADIARAWRDADLTPSADLWRGIAARLEPPSAVSAPARVLPWYRRRVSLGLVELAVAATLVVAVAAGVLWRRAPAPAAPSPTTASTAAAPVLAQGEPLDGPPAGVAMASFADAQFDAAVADLERVLRQQRDRLNPRTVQVLERNLQIIDEAIREARDALAADPANALLNAHLAGARQRKLNVLRRAALFSEGV